LKEREIIDFAKKKSRFASETSFRSVSLRWRLDFSRPKEPSLTGLIDFELATDVMHKALHLVLAGTNHRSTVDKPN
jgi:hypothetical protein